MSERRKNCRDERLPLKPRGEVTIIGPVTWIYIAIGLVVVIGFALTTARSYRNQWDSQQPTDDLRRADDHDPNPPDDGTGGWV